MKKIMLSTAFLAATGFSAAALEGTIKFREAADPMEIHASEFLGKTVYASEAALDGDAYSGVQTGWENIGEINDVILSRDGAVDAVLIDVGGFLGMGEHQIAVEMTSIRFVADDATPDDLSDYFLVTNAPRALLEAAPEYSWGHTDETGTSTKMVDNKAMLDPIMRDGFANVPPQDMTTEMLTGAPVYDANDEWIGEVSQLNIDTDGSITKAVVDVGGFLGMGEKPVELALADIDILRQEGGTDLRVYVSMTKDQLEAMPTYEN
ncbi:MAG: PRC-barrel domain-containing protein [Albidovulum sp.]